MGTVHAGWYNQNEAIAYPLDDAATAVDDAGEFLPGDIIADLNLRFPDDYGRFPFVAAVAVSARLVTVLIEAADAADGPATFRPLAALAAADPEPYRPLALLPQAAGVGGWIVLGRGAAGRVGYRGRLSTPRQGLLAARAARAYRPLPVTGLGDYRAAARLTGVVRLRADAPLRLRVEERVIDGVTRDAVVVGLAGGGSDFLPSAAAPALGSGASNVFRDFAGPCGGRPESGSCGDPQPIEFVNSVGPDCDGVLTLEFRGCARVAKLVDRCGLVVECPSDVAELCPEPYLPDASGSFPEEAPGPDLSAPDAGPTPDTPDGDESVSEVGALPYTECFDDGTADDFAVKTGTWNVVADDTADENAWCPVAYLPPGDSLSGTEVQGAYAATDAAVQAVSVWEGFDPSTLGRRLITDVKILAAPPGARRAAGAAINYRPHETVAGQVEFFVAELDYPSQRLLLRRCACGLTTTLASAPMVGLALDAWHRLTVTTAPAGGGLVNVTARVQSVPPGVDVTLGPVAVGDYYPSSGRFGFWADRTAARFAVFRLEVA